MYKKVFEEHFNMFFAELFAVNGVLYKNTPKVDTRVGGDTHYIEISWYDTKKDKNPVLSLSVEYDMSSYNYSKEVIVYSLSLYDFRYKYVINYIRPSVLENVKKLVLGVITRYLPYKINNIKYRS